MPRERINTVFFKWREDNGYRVCSLMNVFQKGHGTHFHLRKMYLKKKKSLRLRSVVSSAEADVTGMEIPSLVLLWSQVERQHRPVLKYKTIYSVYV